MYIYSINNSSDFKVIKNTVYKYSYSVAYLYIIKLTVLFKD